MPVGNEGDEDGPFGDGGPRSQTLVVDAPHPMSRSSRSRAVLTTATGNQTGRVYAIPPNEIVTMGRGDNCTLRFDEASISGMHARIVLIGTDYMFADNKSTNGSYINEARVESPTKLADGDRIRLGPQCSLRFSLVDEDEEQALKKMYEAALYDGLTKVFNRKHLEERLDAEIAFALRHNTELSVIMVDVDYFKKVNDTYGHLAGDAVLRSTAQILAHGLRTEDLLARYGGEEFVIVARGIPVAQACMVADRLRAAIESSIFPFEQHQLRVTASGGVASLRDCGPRLDKPSLLGFADQRLYQAKLAGRNRIIGP
jgi:diguanylate cyclase (GGDEF)-like protein